MILLEMFPAAADTSMLIAGAFVLTFPAARMILPEKTIPVDEADADAVDKTTVAEPVDELLDSIMQLRTVSFLPLYIHSAGAVVVGNVPMEFRIMRFRELPPSI